MYRALHTSLKIHVVVKVLLPERRGEWGLSASEAQLLARLSHPNILRILDDVPEAPLPYLVLEYVDGLSLHEVIQHSGALRPQRAVAVLSKIAEALGFAWEHGVLHRDIKPANILLTRSGSPRLADLGIASLTSGHRLGIEVVSEEEGVVVGTPSYMAPERFEVGVGEDHRADIYALGVTLFEALTGRPPFREDALPELIHRVQSEPVPSPQQFELEVPQGLCEVVQRMLAKSPEDRPQTWGEVVEELAPFGRGETTRRSRTDGESSTSVWSSFVGMFSKKRGEAS